MTIPTLDQVELVGEKKLNDIRNEYGERVSGSKAIETAQLVAKSFTNQTKAERIAGLTCQLMFELLQDSGIQPSRLRRRQNSGNGCKYLLALVGTR